MRDGAGATIAEWIFARCYLDKHEIVETVIDKLNSAALLKICQIKTQGGRKLGREIFEEGRGRSYCDLNEIGLLITKLESQALAEIFQDEEYATFVNDFFRDGNAHVCIDLLTRLPAEVLAQICRKEFGNESSDYNSNYWGGGPTPREGRHRIYTLVHRILLDRDELGPCHLDFIKKLPSEVLSASAKLIETSKFSYSFAERLFSYKDFQTCQTLITKLSFKAVMQGLNHLLDRMQDNRNLSVGEKQQLTDFLHPYKILQHPQLSVQKQPDKLVQFLRDQILKLQGIEEAEYLIEITKTATHFCLAKDGKTLSALQGLYSKLYLTIQDFTFLQKQKQKQSKLKEQKNHKDSKNENKEVSLSRRKKIHHTLLQIPATCFDRFRGG